MARQGKQPKENKIKKQKKAKKEPKPLESCGSRIIGNPVRVLVILAVISAIIGVALFQFYDAYKSYFDYIVGGLVIVMGLVSIIFYFAKRMIDGVYRSEFAIGVLCIAFGTYVALNGGVSFSFLVIIGAMCAFDGVVKLQYTLDLARMRFKAWWVLLLFSVLGLVIGIAILMQLFEELFGESEGVAMAGLALCANALFDVICAIVIAVRNHKAKKAKRQQEALAAMTASVAAAAKEEELPEVEVEVEEIPADEVEAALQDEAEIAPEDAPEGETECAELQDEAAAETTETPDAEEASEEASSEQTPEEPELAFPAEPVPDDAPEAE